MKRTVLALVALIAIVGVRPIYGQDFRFVSVNNQLSDLGNHGAVGVSARTGFLNTLINDGRGLQPNSLPNFNTIDLAVGRFNSDGLSDIAAISADDTNFDGVPD